MVASDNVRVNVSRALLLIAIIIFVLLAVSFKFLGIDLNWTAVGLAFFAASFWR